MLTTADMTTDREVIIFKELRTMKSQKYNNKELMTTNKLVLTSTTNKLVLTSTTNKLVLTSTTNKLVLTSTKITLCTKLKLKFSTTKIFQNI
jgi:hypothetical protein